MMERNLPSNLSPEDLRVYRRWTRGLYLSYFTVVVVALGLTFVNRPEADPTASKDAQFAHNKQGIANGNVWDRRGTKPFDDPKRAE